MAKQQVNAKVDNEVDISWTMDINVDINVDIKVDIKVDKVEIQHGNKFNDSRDGVIISLLFVLFPFMPELIKA